jgi:hypothetical protein
MTHWIFIYPLLPWLQDLGIKRVVSAMHTDSSETCKYSISHNEHYFSYIFSGSTKYTHHRLIFYSGNESLKELHPQNAVNVMAY